MSNQTWSFDQRIPNDTAVGRDLLNQLVVQLKLANWSEHDVHGVHLSVEEALVNAIKHGNNDDPKMYVHVMLKVSTVEILVKITDEGEGFDPLKVPDPTLDENLSVPSGRGLMLMRAFMSVVRYNEKGNQVIMEKVKN
jgi:serine/threonine-protein kinase RsbW